MLGVREQGDSTPVSINDQWHLGSETKAMTAMLVGIYVDRNVVRYESTIGDSTSSPSWPAW